MAELDDLINDATKSLIKAPKEPDLTYVRANSPEIQGRAADMLTTAMALPVPTAPKKLEKQPRKVVETAFRQFETAVGYRDKLVKTLQHTPANSLSFKLIQKLLQDPDFLDNETKSLFSMCQKYNITLAAMVLAFKDAKSAEISLNAIIRLAESAPVVIDQLGEDATNHFTPCHVCEGTARIRMMNDQGEWMRSEDGAGFKTRLCLHCRGTGKMFKEHDANSRKQFLQITGILDERKGNININTGNQTTVGSMKLDFSPGDGSFEKLIRAVDLLGARQPEPEVIEGIIENEIVIYEDTTNPEGGQP